MVKYIKLAADGTDLPADATGHQAVRVERDILARPLIVTAFRSPQMNWKDANKWAESLDTYGWSWRLPTIEEALLLCDRSRPDNVLPPEYFPDCEGEWIWTSSPTAWNSGAAWGVSLDDGGSGWDFHVDHSHVRAVRAGQF